ncbi:MAG: SPOR domain-containing protein [Chitinispirillaceae bacterium]|nr:SPOR domain-containing protein [Chitinispirillaceae bacterium]
MGMTPYCRIRRCCVFLLLAGGLPAGAETALDSGGAAAAMPLVGQEAPEAGLAAARAMPCSSAVNVFQALAADSTIPDSVRRDASGRRADIAFALREYETARKFYKKAAAFEKGAGRYRYRTAVAALANGDTAEAAGIFSAVIDSGEAPFSHEAAVQKGEILLAREDFQGAMDLFRKTGPFSFRNSWSIHALLGKLACARALGLADSAAAYDKKLSGYRQTILEKERLRKTREIPCANADGAAAAAPEKDTASADTVFAVQVGAFGSKANAEAMVKKLKRKYREVSCVAGIVEERTFYRVWVGKFDTREAAERFGREKMMREGFVYRVVVK